MSSANFRPLPDPEIGLRDARDFIIGSSLGRRAAKSGQPLLSLFLHDLLEAVHRLVQSCHLPEFTDHGLPHLCSLVDRVSRWELTPGGDGKISRLVDVLDPDEAAILLIAVLIHDIGMLSQNPIDLPDDAPGWQSKSLWSDVATWVRQTHVPRMEKLVRRVLNSPDHKTLLESPQFATACDIARSHQEWPWNWKGDWTEEPRNKGLAAVLAVIDLLDEDAARCDTTTLLEHREGNITNRAHWLRHALTDNRVLVERGKIAVKMVRPPGTGEIFKPLYSALRNHFRLVLLYDADLKTITAQITQIVLDPSTGLPDGEAGTLANWKTIHGFGTESALCYQLLRTFMAPAIKDNRLMDANTVAAFKVASLEDVDLGLLLACEGVDEPRSDFEYTFAALTEAETPK